MTTVTSCYGETAKIRTICAGYAVVDAKSTRPEIVITREDDGKWYACYEGSARLHNRHAGYQIAGGCKTRSEAVLWLLER